MQVETIALEEARQKPVNPQKRDEPNCIFYKKEACNPNKMNFKICGRCHRSKAITMENLVPRIFERIIGLAIMLMNMSSASSGSSTGSGTGTGSGGGAGAGGGGGH